MTPRWERLLAWLATAVRRSEHLLSPRATLLVAAGAIEAAALCLWPTIFLMDGQAHLSDMFLARYGFLQPILIALKSMVDWVFPGALWTWEHIVAFFFQCLIVCFVAYALAAWRLTPTAGSIGGSAVGLRWILIPVAIFEATLILVPATLTTDIYNYALYGEMPVRYGANPFVHVPADFPQSPLYYLIPLYWHDAPSVYGPFWIAISAGVATVFRALPLADEILCYRLIANAAHLANIVLVWAIARRLWQERAASAALAYGWNPLLLVDFAQSGHNDVLMLTFVLGGFLLATYQRARSAAFLLGLSIAIKYTSALVAPGVLLYSARTRLPRSAVEGRQEDEGPNAGGRGLDVLALLLSGAIAAGTVIVLYVPWIRGTDTFGPVLYWVSGPRLNNFAPEALLISLAAWTSGLFGSYETAWETILDAFKLVAKIGLAGLILVEALRARTMEHVLAASARVSLVFLLLVNTWVMPWYYTWPLTFCAALGWRSLLVRMCAGFTLTALVLLYQRQLGHTVVDDWAGLFLILPLLIPLAPAVVRYVAAGGAGTVFGSQGSHRQPNAAGAG